MAVFTVEVSLLGGQYEATHPISGHAEWPPHPYRVFAAMVAAAGDRRTHAQADVLRWLEAQPPPTVTASDAQRHAGATRYVPLNRPEFSPRYPFDVLRGELRQPVAVPEVPLVAFTWPSAPPAELFEALTELAAAVAYLGRSSSPVSVRVTGAAPDAKGLRAWWPDAGNERLRIPRPGLLSMLDARYDGADIPPWSAEAGYGIALPSRETPPETTGPFAEDLVVFRCVDGPRVPIERALTVTSLFRQALLRQLDQDSTSVFTGHHEGSVVTHAAYLPAPQVGDAHADGHLLGVMVALPRDASEQEHELLRRRAPTRLTLGRRLGVWTLKEPDPLDIARAELAEAGPRPSKVPWALRSARWTRAAREWTSATPVVLPFRTISNGSLFRREASRAIRRACVKAGYPEPVEVEVAPVAWVHGGGHARRFHTARRPGDQPRATVHTYIRFPESVRGPVLLGPMRYFGLGLLVPETGSRQTATGQVSA